MHHFHSASLSVSSLSRLSVSGAASHVLSIASTPREQRWKRSKGLPSIIPDNETHYFTFQSLLLSFRCFSFYSLPRLSDNLTFEEELQLLGMWFFSLSVVTDRLTGSTVFLLVFFHTHAQCKDRQTNRVCFFFLRYCSCQSSLPWYHPKSSCWGCREGHKTLAHS